MGNHLKIIYNYISTHISTTEDINDIVQETMFAVWRGIESFDHNSTFKTWVIGITRRKIADYYRASYKKTIIPLAEVENLLINENGLEGISDNIDVQNAVVSLNETEKEIIFLVFNAQLSYSEISEITNIPVGTIKSRMSTIKVKLRKRLENGGCYD